MENTMMDNTRPAPSDYADDTNTSSSVAATPTAASAGAPAATTGAAAAQVPAAAASTDQGYSRDSSDMDESAPDGKTPGATPAAISENKPGNFGRKVGRAILAGLGGTDEVEYHKTPDGRMVATVAKKGPGQQFKQIIASALEGAFGGANVKPGPGHLGRSAAAGFDAGEQGVQDQTDEKMARAQKDFDDTNSVIRQKAQTAYLTQQTTALAFANSRNKIKAAYDDSDRENSFAAAIKTGGSQSTDLGVAKDMGDILKMHADMPNLVKEQAQGNIIGTPHVNASGEIDGMRYALVTPEWKAAKLDGDQTYYDLKPPAKPGDAPTIEKQTVKAGTMTNGDFWNVRTAKEHEIQQFYSDAYKQKQETDRTAMTQAGENARQVKELNTRIELSKGKATRADIVTHDKAYVQPANSTEKSYQMFQHAYDEYQAAAKQGKTLPTGAQSMLALSQHLQTTFGQVKGARVTKDMIQHHLGARSVSDSALVAVQRLTNGDVLSPDQWSAFHDMVGESRRLSWETAVKEAKRKDIPVDFLPKDLQGMAAPDGADNEVYVGGKLAGHTVNGKYVPLGKEK